MLFDPKRYKVDVVVPLAKDRARMDAVATAIRDLKSGASEQALAPVNAAGLFALDPGAPGDLAAHFATLELSLNKWGGNPPSASLIKQLLHAMKDAGFGFEQPVFWVAQAKEQAKEQAAQLGGFMDGVKADYPLGVVTPEQLDRASKGAGLGAVPAGDLLGAAKRAGLTVGAEFDDPTTPVPPILSAALNHPDFRTIADLLVFPGRATNVSFIDNLSVDGRAVTLADIATAHRNSETAKDSNAVQDAQKALGLLKSQCTTDSALHALVFAALIKQIVSIVGQGGTRLQQRDGLVARGLSLVDASRAVSKLNPSGGGAAAKAASVQIAEALAGGDLAEARRLAAALPEADEDRADRADVVARLELAERQKQTHLDSYERAIAVRDFGSAAQALRSAAQLDSADGLIQSKLDALPPARPDAPTLHTEGRTVVAAWPQAAESSVKYVVVRSVGGAAPVAPTGGTQVGSLLEATSVADERPPVGKRVRYTVFSTRDGIRFSDGASAELLVLPAPTDLVATVDASQVSLSWQMSNEAIAAQVTQQSADGAVVTIEVATGTSLSVPGLTLGMKYAYGVRAAYATANGRELSAPTLVDATPRGAIGAARDFGISTLRTDAGGESLQASWLEIEGYTVDVWAFPVGYRPTSGQRVTTSALTASGGRRLSPLPGGTVSAGVETRRYAAGLGVFAYSPLTVDGEGGVLGDAVVSGAAPSATGMAAERFGDGLKVSWVWPEGDYIIEVAWRQDGRSRSSRITRAKYRVDGGVTISPATGVTDLSIATVVKMADEEWVSTPAPIALSGSKPSVGYSVTIKKSMFKAGSVEVRVDPGDFSGALDIELVCATGPFMPLTPADGSVLAAERLVLTANEPTTFTCSLPKLPSPYWVRMFTVEASHVLLLDPSTTQMKG